MNIGVDIRCLMDKNRTGVGEYTYGFLNAVFSIDKTNQYFLFYNSNKNVSVNIPQWKQDNVHYVFTRWPNKFLNLLVWLRFIRLDNLINSKLNIWFSPNLNFTNLSKKIKHIQVIHDLSFEFFSEYFTFKQRLWHCFLNPGRQCQQADIIITPSENTKRDVVESYKVESSKVIKLMPGILDVRPKTEDVGHRSENVKIKYNLPEKYILYLGTLEPRKNVETIIEAYKKSCVLGLMSYSLVIAGSAGWNNKKLMKIIKETEGVKYIGYVAELDKSTIYQMSNLFIFSSFYEGFGLPVLEAMASNVPVITSNRSSLSEVAGEAGYLVNPHNIDEIAVAIKKILSDKKLHDMLIERGKKRIGEFSWRVSAEDFLKILISICE